MNQPELFAAPEDAPEDIGNTAVFSPCRTYRYVLRRTWAEGPTCNFVMLNPSIADETRPDPTMTRCVNFAKGWGYAGLVITNLFALVSTDPAAMKTHPDPVGPENDDRILTEACYAKLIVCAWGNHGVLRRRGRKVRERLRGVGLGCHYLAMTVRGQPVHPLYLPGDTRPQRWGQP